MQMEGWEDYLHFTFRGEHILFEILLLDSYGTFFVGSVLTALLCLLERSLTYAIAKNWCPFLTCRQNRLRIALWKAALYWAATLLRLTYMLIAMSYNLGLIIVTATALAVGQLLIEYLEVPESPTRDSYRMKEPLLNSIEDQLTDSHSAIEPNSSSKTHGRPHSRPKPGNPNNTFHADETVLEMGITPGNFEPGKSPTP